METTVRISFSRVFCEALTLCRLQLYDAVLNMHLKPRSLFVYGKCNVSTYSLLETIFGLSLACDDDASDRMRTLP